jgi:hypothetical protein
MGGCWVDELQWFIEVDRFVRRQLQRGHERQEKRLKSWPETTADIRSHKALKLKLAACSINHVP